MTRHGIFAIDPGGTTGVAAGIVDLSGGTVAEALASMERRKAAEVKGDWLSQALDLRTKFLKWEMDCERYGVGVPSRHCVIEDFVLRMPATTTTLTSIWVAAAFHGSIAPPVTEVEYQTASQAKSYARDDRIKRWGLWEVGSAHKRDAWRHFALKVNRLLG